MDKTDFSWLLRDFVDDSSERLDVIEASFLEFDNLVGQQPEVEQTNSILGELHTLKGNSGMMGLGQIQGYCHELEGVFKGLQEGAAAVTMDLVTLILGSATILRRAVTMVSEGIEAEPDLQAEIQVLRDFVHQASNVGDVRIETVQLEEEAREVPVLSRSNILRVDIERLDQLMNLMGELIIHRTRLGQICTEIQASLGDSGVVLDLTSATEQIGKVSTELHEAIMKVRMLPIGQVFMRFPRFVRDAAKSAGKDIDLQFSGSDTELDKTVIDEIGEPLMHLIRNGLDHGIETPEERERVGKPRRGTISVRAYQESSYIIIEVQDDGRGLDLEGLQKSAERSGMILAKSASRAELLDLIFLPGLSTAVTVTEVSGRGMGMDIVRTRLASLGGSIDVESETGVGTRFVIRLPLTLAIISALMVEVQTEQYAVPLSGVIESLRVPVDSIHEVNLREVINVRGRILPLARLSRLFGMPAAESPDSLYVVIVANGNERLGLVVDTLLGQQEIVIKALDDYVGNTAGVSGATILGDGRVVLIVDVPALLEERGESTLKHHAA